MIYRRCQTEQTTGLVRELIAAPLRSRMVIMSEQDDTKLVVDDKSDDEDANVDIVTNDDEDGGAQDLSTRLSNGFVVHSTACHTATTTTTTSGLNSTFFTATNLANPDFPTSLSADRNAGSSVCSRRSYLPVPRYSPVNVPRESATSPLTQQGGSPISSSYPHVPDDRTHTEPSPVARFPQEHGAPRSSGSPQAGEPHPFNFPSSAPRSQDCVADFARGSGSTEVSETPVPVPVVSASVPRRDSPQEFYRGSGSPPGSPPAAHVHRGQSVPSPTLSVVEDEEGNRCASPTLSRSPPDSPVEQSLQHHG